MAWWVQPLGYLAAVAAIAGLVLRRPPLPHLAWITGAALFVAYGAVLGAWPLVLAALAVVVFGIVRLRGRLAEASVAEISAIPIEAQHPFLLDFLRANLADIRRSQPDFDPDATAPFVRLVTRHGLPAGVFMGRPEGQELEVVLDYVTPRYRDSKSGRWLLDAGRGTFVEAGIKRLVAHPTTSEHRTYLEALGFRPEGSAFVKEL